MARLGEYTLSSTLGQGGMAAVWQASHVALGIPAAVKVVHSRLDDEAYMRAFFAEARAHAGLEHPHIVRLLDFGHVTPDDEPPTRVDVGRPYLVMERATCSLRDLMPLRSWDDALDILLQVLDALAYSHARGVIHRDLKPENILVFEDDGHRVFKLTDFGIAAPTKVKTAEDRDTLNTSAGTPPYMPPEQLRGDSTRIGPWTDLYALGCIAFELVSGRTPFVGPTNVAIAVKHLQDPIPRLESRNFEHPDDLEEWVTRLLAKSAAERPECAADAAYALLGFSCRFSPSSLEQHDADDDSVGAGPTDISDFAHGLTTILIDDFAHSETLESTEVEVDADLDPDIVTNTAPIGPGPMPQSWRLPDADASGFRGLGLLPLRRIAPIGLDAQRDLLWRTLQKTCSGPTLCLARGAADAPVEALATWFVERAAETGAAYTISTSHSPTQGPGEGIAGLIVDAFSLSRIDPGQFSDEIVRKFHADDPRSAIDAAILANEVLIARGEQTRGRIAASVHELHAALIRMVDTFTTSRPLVIRLEAAQWGVESLAFVQSLLDERPDSSWMLLGTMQTDDEPGPRASQALDELGTELVQVQIAPYNANALKSIALSLVPFDTEAASTLAARAPDPVALTSSIAELVDAHALRLKSDGEFAITATDALCESTRELFKRRITRCVDTRDRAVVELAATLGQSADRGELAAACRHAKIDILPQSLEAALARSGVIRAMPDAWIFAHPEACAAALAPDVELRQRWHRVVAESLETRKGALREDQRLRIAAHWRQSDSPISAWSHYVEAFAHVARSQPARSREILSDAAPLVSTLDPESPAALELRLLELHQEMIEGTPLVTAAIVALRQECQATGFASGFGRGCALLGWHHTYASRFEEAMTEFAQAANTFHQLNLPESEAQAAFGLGFVAYRRGDFPVCEASYQRAARLFGDCGNEERQATVLSYLSAAYVVQDRFDEADAATARTLEIAKRLQSWDIIAEASSDAGEAARYRGEYEKARQSYEEAAYWRRIADSRETPLAEFNLALVDIADAKINDAERRLASVIQAFKTMGTDRRLGGLIDAALAACALASGDSARFETLLNEAVSAQGEGIDRDFAWLAETALQWAQTDAQRQRLISLANHHYAELGLIRRVRSSP